jgi:hypothetical protein
MSATFDLFPNPDQGQYVYIGRCTCSHGSVINTLRLTTGLYQPGTPAIEDLAQDIYTNLLRITGCDDALEMGEIDVPDNPELPPLPPEPEPKSAEPAADPRAGTMNFTLVPVIPPWHHAVTTCPHGRSYAGAWIIPPAPNVPQVKAMSLANHRTRFGCDCVGATPTSLAKVTLGTAMAVVRGTTVPIPQDSATITGTGLGFTANKLRCLQSGLYVLTLVFYLSRSIAQGAVGRGHIWVNGVSRASVALADVDNRATCNLTWSGTLVANEVIEAAFQNDSVQVQAGLGGTLDASSV